VSALIWFLILVGPFLVVGPQAAIAALSLGDFRPASGPRPRPVTRPRPTRLRLVVA
jgi:hypothetical protein